MPKIYAFYNPLAGNGQCKEDVKLLEMLYDDPIEYCDMTRPETYEIHLFSLRHDDTLILCGGDGTVNRFLNLVQDTPIPCDILHFPIGTRNLFAHALGHSFADVPFSVKQQLMNSPSITVDSRTLCFVWGLEFEAGGSHFRKHRSTAISANGINCRRKKLSLTTTPRRDEMKLVLRGYKACQRKPEDLFSGRQVSICFDRPVTIRADGEVIGQATHCATTI